jgi:hypothetical protein
VELSLSIDGILVEAAKKLYNRLKGRKRLQWYSGLIKSSFKRENKDILIELKFLLTNNSGRKLSFPHIFLNLSTPKSPEPGYTLTPNDEPINLDDSETKRVTLHFVHEDGISRSKLRNNEGASRDELIHDGLNAELGIQDNVSNRAKTDIFIYERGLEGLWERLGRQFNLSEFNMCKKRLEKSFFEFPSK